MAHRWVVVLICVVVIASIWPLFRVVGYNFLPDEDESAFQVNLRAPQGTSLAATQEAQGKQDEALSTYQKVSTTFATSFSAPVALLGQARIFKEKGKTDEARRLFEQVINQYPDSMFAQQAMRESSQLKK